MALRTRESDLSAMACSMHLSSRDAGGTSRAITRIIVGWKASLLAGSYSLPALRVT